MATPTPTTAGVGTPRESPSIEKLDEMIAMLKTVRGQVHHIFDVIIAMGSSGLVDVPEHKAMGDDLRTSVISINEALAKMRHLDAQVTNPVRPPDVSWGAGETAALAHADWATCVAKRGRTVEHTASCELRRLFPAVEAAKRARAERLPSPTMANYTDRSAAAAESWSSLREVVPVLCSGTHLEATIRPRAIDVVTLTLICANVFQALVQVRHAPEGTIELERIGFFGVGETPASALDSSAHYVFRAVSAAALPVLMHVREHRKPHALADLIRWVDSYHNLFSAKCAASQRRLILDSPAHLVPPVARSFPGGVPYHSRHTPPTLIAESEESQ